MAPEVNLRGYRKSSRRSAVKSSFAAKLHALLAPGPSRYSKRSQFVPPRRTKIRVKLSSAGETKVQSRGGKFETRIGYVEVQRARREIYGSRIDPRIHARERQASLADYGYCWDPCLVRDAREKTFCGAECLRECLRLVRESELSASTGLIGRGSRERRGGGSRKYGAMYTAIHDNAYH